MNITTSRAVLKHMPALTSILVAVTGLVSLAQVLTIHVRHHRFGQIDDSLLPFTTAQSSRLFILSVGLVLLYLSIQIYRRKALAYQLVSMGLAGLIVAELLIFENVAQLAFYVVTLGLLFVTRSQFTVATNNLSLRRGAAMAGVIILVVFVYATIGFSELGTRANGTDIGVPTAMRYAAREIFTFQENQPVVHSRRAGWFLDSVNTAATLAYGLALFSLFRPLQFQYGAPRRDRELARRILESSSTSTEDYFKLWPPDKHYFFSPDEDSFVAYKVIGSDVFVLGGPSGNAGTFPRLLHDFETLCRQSGWVSAFVNIGSSLEQYTDPGAYQRLFIGNEAIIDVPVFAGSTSRSKHFRYIRNRAERDGLAFEYWPAPLTPTQIRQLRRISNAWLGDRSRREYTFALGYFDPEYLLVCDVAVVIREGKPVAYTNIVPGFQPEARTIDHMRYTEAMPPTGMHYLLMQLIQRLHEGGVQHFNLGLAPLSGIEEREAGNLPERLLGALKKLGGNYYSFGGLEQFKNKFEPAWQPRYIYYSGTPARLLRLATNFSRAVSVPVAGRTRRLVVIGLSVAAALCYTSFPLAYLLNPARTTDGLVSELGSSGQAYAGLFNGIDVASSLLVFIVIALLWGRLRAGSQLPRLVLILLGLSALGNMLAALTPLPAYNFADLQNGLHDFLSAVNLFAMIGATFGLVLYAKRRRWLIVLFVLLVLSLAASAMFEGHILGSAAQRLQIALTALWIIIIPAVLSRSSRRVH